MAHEQRFLAEELMNPSALSAASIERQILTLRGHRVMLDAHLAVLYGVETRILKQAVRRNLDRFPEDFMFQLTWEEGAALRSQTVILKPSSDPGLESQSVTLKRGTYHKIPAQSRAPQPARDRKGQTVLTNLHARCRVSGYAMQT